LLTFSARLLLLGQVRLERLDRAGQPQLSRMAVAVAGFACPRAVAALEDARCRSACTPQRARITRGGERFSDGGVVHAELVGDRLDGHSGGSQREDGLLALFTRRLRNAWRPAVSSGSL